MSYFRNIELDGKWAVGGTYTFEVDLRATDVDAPGSLCWNPFSGTCDYIGQFNTSGFGLYTDGDSFDNDTCGNLSAPYSSGNRLFDNDSSDFDGGLEGLTVLDTEILEDGWTKYTVQIAEDLPYGTYYLKGREYHFNWAIM